MKHEEAAAKDSKILKNKNKIRTTLIFVSIIFIAKFTGAYITHSLALFSDSWHLLTDIAALIISWLGLKVSEKAANSKYTYGYYRYSILTALLNNISLIFISIFIFYKAVTRYLNPIEVHPEGMIFFSILGLMVNLVIVKNLMGDSTNMNIRSVFVHFIGDALSDIGVLIGGTVIYFTHFTGIDTFLSSILACLILKNALQMSLECIKILLEAAPKNISIAGLKQEIKNLENIIEVTDIHVWSLSSEMHAMTAHIAINENNILQCEDILHNIQHLLKEDFNINHSTIQFEHMACSSCYYNKKDPNCSATMCIDKCKID